MMSHLEGTEYPKINGVFKRYTDGPDKGRFIMGDFAQREFETLLHVKWRWSEKIDGTNIRLVYVPPSDGYEVPRVFIGGRTSKSQLHPDLIQAIQDMIDPELWAATFGDQVAVVYGEGYGAGIQGVGHLYRPDKSFIGFDVRVGQTWLDHDDAFGVMQSLGLNTVRSPWTETLAEALNIFGLGKTETWFPSAFNPEAFEGIVGRPVGGLLDRHGHRIQTKLKVVDFRG